MKILKLIPVVIKNFLLIVFYETRKFIKSKPFLSLIIFVAVIVIIGGGIWGWQKYNNRAGKIIEDEVTLSEAAKMGEVTTHKLLVQIEVPKGSPEDIKGRHERGDIVLIKNADHEFSIAEKTGFLILKMDITEKQSELLVRSLEAQTGEKEEDGAPRTEQLKRRKFTIDLSKIGISPDDQKGREEEKIYSWDIVKEK